MKLFTSITTRERRSSSFIRDNSPMSYGILHPPAAPHDVLNKISQFENSIREKATHWSKAISGQYMHIKDRIQVKHIPNPLTFEYMKNIQTQFDLGIHVFQSGVNPIDRQMIWPHLLGIIPLGIDAKDRFKYFYDIDLNYTKAKFEWQSDLTTKGEISEHILKDVDRTDRTHDYLNVPNEHPNFIKLFNITATYISESGGISHYCQGMSDLASLFACTIESEALAYACFKQYMQKQKLIFLPETGAFPARCALLTTLIEMLDPKFYQYLDKNDATNMIFTYRWFLLNLKREFKFHETVKLFEVIIASRMLALNACNLSPEQNKSLNQNCQNSHFNENVPINPTYDDEELQLNEVYKDVFPLFMCYQLLACYKKDLMKKNATLPLMCQFYAENSGQHNFDVILKLAKGLFLLYICENITFETESEKDYVYI